MIASKPALSDLSMPEIFHIPQNRQELMAPFIQRQSLGSKLQSSRCFVLHPGEFLSLIRQLLSRDSTNKIRIPRIKSTDCIPDSTYFNLDVIVEHLELNKLGDVCSELGVSIFFDDLSGNPL